MKPAYALGAVGATAVAGAAAYAAPSLVRALPPRLFPSLCGIGRRGHVALTFDDGPDPASTPAVLDMLDRLGWRATFFCLGSMAESTGGTGPEAGARAGANSAPGLLQEMVAAGHEIAVHGYTHDGAIRRTPGKLVDDVTRTRDLLHHVTGTVPHWYRPPYGEMSAGTFVAARRSGLRLVLWSAWGRDWRPEATPGSVVNDLSRGTVDGGTLLLHDSDCTSVPSSWRMTVAALPLLAERLGQYEHPLDVGILGDHGLDAA